jgi:hypothetical protein
VEGGKVVGANVACSCSAVIDPSDGAINFDDLAQHVGYDISTGAALLRQSAETRDAGTT